MTSARASEQPVVARPLRAVGRHHGLASSSARQLGLGDLIAADMGGTSFEACLLPGGEPTFTNQEELEWGVPIALTMVDARVDRRRRRQHRPGRRCRASSGSGRDSAGADPGPACYGRGGTAADRDGRQRRPRPPRPGVPSRRRLRARLRRGRPRRSTRSPAQLGLDRRPRRPGHRRRGQQQHGPGPAARLDRPRLRPPRAQRWSPTAAPGRCTPASSHGPCRCARSSSRAIPAPSRPSARCSPTRASTTRRRTGCACASSTSSARQRDLRARSSGQAPRRVPRTRASARRRLVRRSIDVRYVGQNWELELELPGGELTPERLRGGRAALRGRARALLRLRPPGRGARDPDVQAGRDRHAPRARAADGSHGHAPEPVARRAGRLRRRATRPVETAALPPGRPSGRRRRSQGPPSIGQVDATTLLPPAARRASTSTATSHVTDLRRTKHVARTTGPARRDRASRDRPVPARDHPQPPDHHLQARWASR